jgi:hypothetical protein
MLLDDPALAVDHTALHPAGCLIMHVGNLICATILACIASAATADEAADQACPKLPANSGFTWTYQRGPDFGVCYAEKAGNPQQKIGVYIGFAPDFQPDQKQILQKGRIGAAVVQWYRKQTTGERFKVGAETLYSRGQTINHIWLLAADQPSLVSLITLSESLDFGSAK